MELHFFLAHLHLLHLLLVHAVWIHFHLHLVLVLHHLMLLHDLLLLRWHFVGLRATTISTKLVFILRHSLFTWLFRALLVFSWCLSLLLGWHWCLWLLFSVHFDDVAIV
jgi:hypothetical protein